MKNGNENAKKKTWVNKDTDKPTRIHCEIQYNNETLENLRRTFRQNTERIDEIWKDYKETVEQLANSLGKRIDVEMGVKESHKHNKLFN